MFKFKSLYKKFLADTHTPVSIYLKLRDKFPNSLLLESSDYHSSDHSFSYICCEPIAGIKLENDILYQHFPNGVIKHETIKKDQLVVDKVRMFSSMFSSEDLGFNFVTHGLFGYLNFDAIQYFEDISLTSKISPEKSTPDLMYHVFKYVLVVDHFKNELYVIQHTLDEAEFDGISGIVDIISNKNFASYSFNSDDKLVSNFTDIEFLNVVEKGIDHCKRGDVFQLVLSREFKKTFRGDEFNVYRTLRAINPSPYLFFFDYGNFKIFGSSPESQIIIKGDAAGIYPIAGTYKRTGDDDNDTLLAEQLKNDPKEKAEHIMLVDLARNDLSRNADQVKVETFSEIQFYSHVIHMVSKVTGKIKSGSSAFRIVADTFPAGTLSGAPKYRAIELIDHLENGARGFYGGGIGYMGFNGDFNHAIMIRSFLSKGNTLFYQAGAGIVAESVKENELNEVTNKLSALNMAIEMANGL